MDDGQFSVESRNTARAQLLAADAENHHCLSTCKSAVHAVHAMALHALHGLHARSMENDHEHE
jgi:hypothetical protein